VTTPPAAATLEVDVALTATITHTARADGWIAVAATITATVAGAEHHVGVEGGPAPQPPGAEAEAPPRRDGMSVQRAETEAERRRRRVEESRRRNRERGWAVERDEHGKPQAVRVPPQKS
jgi:hypothetical protein